MVVEWLEDVYPAAYRYRCRCCPVSMERSNVDDRAINRPRPRGTNDVVGSKVNVLALNWGSVVSPTRV